MSMAICVYCSSSDRIDPAYFAVARDLGEAIGRRGHSLVWGGGRVGLMGELARGARATGGRVVGVIPRSLHRIEVADGDADELIVTADMRERKQIMDDRADAFVVLPGGFGTLEELTEMLVQKILGYTDRPLVILNAAGYFDPLIDLFDHFIAHRFAKDKHRQLFDVVASVEDVFASLDNGTGSPRAGRGA